MTRLVKGADGRMWTVRSQLEWTNPATSDDFEHDVAGGRGAGVGMAVLVALLAVGLIVWTPEGVFVPPWLVLALILAMMFFPARWVLRRPWRVVAETPGDADERPPQRWVGTIRGVFAVRQEVAKIARNIEVYSEPDFRGPLQLIE
ncbi:DUF983 domain-containing protein [Pseudonocardiaceae bacterium YIM PH 21723]|nr:DUF983 domain-containing protein [Pseudonocardiaceae bacterium YIM PH 21723]